MAFIDRYLLAANDVNFQRRCEIATVIAAVNAQAETPSGLALPTGYAPTGAADDTAKKQKLHEVRAALANRILIDPGSIGRLFAVAVASDPNNAGITTASTDADIQFTVNSLFNAFAVTGNA